MTDCVIRKASPPGSWNFKMESRRNLDYRVCSSIWLPCLSVMWKHYSYITLHYRFVCHVIKLSYWKYGALSTCTYVVLLLSHTNYHVLCRYRLVLAKNANGNDRHIHFVFLTYNWNASNSRATSFLALNSSFRDKSKPCAGRKLKDLTSKLSKTWTHQTKGHLFSLCIGKSLQNCTACPNIRW